MPVPYRSLTRRNKAGEVLKRPPDVEQQILACLDLEPRELIARAETANETPQDYIKPESLVFFIREYHRADEDDIVNRLAGVLTDRSPELVRKKLARRGVANWKDLVLDALASLIVDVQKLDSDVGDFLQVCFQESLWRETLTLLGKDWKDAAKSARFVPLSALSGLEVDPEDGDGQLYPLPESLIEDFPAVEDRLLAEDALSQLKEPIRTAFVLRYREGWPIESKDPNEATISSALEVTPRTIRNWLKEAHESLAAWRGENA